MINKFKCKLLAAILDLHTTYMAILTIIAVCMTDLMTFSDSIHDSVLDSVLNSVNDSFHDSVYNSIDEIVQDSIYVSLHHVVMMSCYVVMMSHCHVVVMMSHCHVVMMSHCHFVALLLSCCQDFMLLYFQFGSLRVLLTDGRTDSRTSW